MKILDISDRLARLLPEPLPMSSRRSWRGVGEKELRREQYGVIISLLQHVDWHDLAHVAALRASGKHAKVALVSDDLRIIEVLER